MNRTCVIVADGKGARFFGVEEVESPRVKFRLVERTALTSETDLKTLGKSVTGRTRTETNTNREGGPKHPIGAQRERHRLELERRFGREIARETRELTKDWKEGTVVLIAEPRLLGLMREPLRRVMHPGIELKELAKDYAQLTASELQDHIVLNSIVPARRGGEQ